MKINFSTQLLDVFGKPTLSAEPGAGKPVELTLGGACIQALIATFPDEQHLPGAKKAERFVLATKIAGSNDKPLDLSTEQVAALKEVVGKAWGTAVVGPAFALLDPT